MLSTEHCGSGGNGADRVVPDEGGDMAVTPLRERKAWQALERHHAEIAGRHLRDLFAEDPSRGERLTVQAAGLSLDYSKNRITDETLGLLVDLARESGVPQRRGAVFRGGHLNATEGRGV